MLVTGLFFLYFCANLSGAAVYDIFTGETLSDEQFSTYQDANLTEICTVNITSCDTEELRRVDGSCNNINRPAKGISLAPPIRIVLPVFDNGYKPRRAVSGNRLPVSRDVGQIILSGYKRNDCNFTQLMTSFGMFMFWDVGALNNSRWYPGNNTLISYQELGCTNDSTLTPVVDGTNVFDLSEIYNPGNNGDEEIRSYEEGELLDIDDKNETDSSLNDECEYRRYEHFPNLPLRLMRIWFVKHHNYIAGNLACLNPCWDDERLFREAREINIAFFLQTFLYEWLELFEGREHLINVGILANNTGFRDIYDETKYPTVSLEFLYISSWFLSTLDVNAEMYDKDGDYVDEVNMLKIKSLKKFLNEDNNREYLIQGQFRQPSRKIDHSFDKETAYLMASSLDGGEDFVTSELDMGRTLGIAPYIHYVYYCTGRNITNFNDLHDYMDTENVIKLMHHYENVADIELLVGIWNEKVMKGGHLPPTQACLMNDHILKTIQADRHWYERPNRPHAFTYGQLQEIRKASAALLLCSVGEGVKEIQRNAFLNINSNNQIVTCSEIKNIDFTLWIDNSCYDNINIATTESVVEVTTEPASDSPTTEPESVVVVTTESVSDVTTDAATESEITEATATTEPESVVEVTTEPASDSPTTEPESVVVVTTESVSDVTTDAATESENTEATATTESESVVEVTTEPAFDLPTTEAESLVALTTVKPGVTTGPSASTTTYETSTIQTSTAKTTTAKTTTAKTTTAKTTTVKTTTAKTTTTPKTTTTKTTTPKTTTPKTTTTKTTTSKTTTPVTTTPKTTTVKTTTAKATTTAKTTTPKTTTPKTTTPKTTTPKTTTTKTTTPKTTTPKTTTPKTTTPKTTTPKTTTPKTTTPKTPTPQTSSPYPGTHEGIIDANCDESTGVVVDGGCSEDVLEEISDAPCDESIDSIVDHGCSEDGTDSTEGIANAPCDETVDSSVDTFCNEDVTDSTDEISNAPCDETVDSSVDTFCNEDVTDSTDEFSNAPCDEIVDSSVDTFCNEDVTDSSVSTSTPLTVEDVSCKETVSNEEITDAPCDDTVDSSEDALCSEDVIDGTDAGCNEDATESSLSSSTPVSAEEGSFEDNETTTSKTVSLEEISNAPCDETVDSSVDTFCSEDVTDSSLTTSSPDSEEEDVETVTHEEITSAPCDETTNVGLDTTCNEDVTDSTVNTVDATTVKTVSDEVVTLEPQLETSESASHDEIAHAPCDETADSGLEAYCSEDETESTVSTESSISIEENTFDTATLDATSETPKVEDVTSEAIDSESTASETASLEDVTNAPCDETVDAETIDSFCEEDDITTLQTSTTNTTTEKSILIGKLRGNTD